MIWLDGRGGSSRFMWFKLGKFAHYFLLGVSVLGIGLLLNDLYVVLGPQDSLGRASSNCGRQDFPTVPNGSGMTATAHLVDCSYGIAHGADTTFVYVHKVGENDTRQSLIFRFANAGNLNRPRMAWSDDSTLHILVSEVGEVTKQVASLDGVKISYAIGKEDMSREESYRLRMHEAKTSLAWLILWVGICVLTVKSILKRNGRVVQPAN
jgi:hypothetical protein